MPLPQSEKPDLPEYMTWEELEQLPEEIAEQIELWDGRVVWVRRGPAEHQTFTYRMTAAIERCARKSMSQRPETCLRVTLETNVSSEKPENRIFSPGFPGASLSRLSLPGHSCRRYPVGGRGAVPIEYTIRYGSQKGSLRERRDSLVLGSHLGPQAERDRHNPRLCPGDQSRRSSARCTPASRSELSSDRRVDTCRCGRGTVRLPVPDRYPVVGPRVLPLPTSGPVCYEQLGRPAR